MVEQRTPLCDSDVYLQIFVVLLLISLKFQAETEDRTGHQYNGNNTMSNILKANLHSVEAFSIVFNLAFDAQIFAPFVSLSPSHSLMNDVAQSIFPKISTNIITHTHTPHHLLSSVYYHDIGFFLRLIRCKNDADATKKHRRRFRMINMVSRFGDRKSSACMGCMFVHESASDVF